MVDGYADLDPDGRPGLGAHAHAEFGVPVIGVAKTAFRTATHAIPVLGGPGPAAVCHRRRDVPRSTPRTSSATWRASYRIPDALRRADTLARNGPPVSV